MLNEKPQSRERFLRRSSMVTSTAIGALGH